MRTTIRIKDDLLERAKKRAAEEGRTLTSLIEDALALAVANVLLDQAHCVIIQPGERHWEIFTRLCTEADARGNLVDDAWFSALATVNHRSVPNDFVVHPGDRLSLFPREVPIFADWLDHRF